MEQFCLLTLLLLLLHVVVENNVFVAVQFVVHQLINEQER